MQPNSQLDLTENRARNGKSRDVIWGDAEFWGVERGALPDAVFLYLEMFDFHI
jgi:hypothetical protein